MSSLRKKQRLNMNINDDDDLEDKTRRRARHKIRLEFQKLRKASKNSTKTRKITKKDKNISQDNAVQVLKSIILKEKHDSAFTE
jgi:hypothetical protein